MAEDKEAVKTAEALAAVETPPTETEKPPVEETEPAEKPVETPDESQEAPEKPDAKAFQAMRHRIQELESEVATKSADVGPLVPRVETPTPEGEVVNQTQFFNQETGEFDAVGYQKAVREDAMKSAAAITTQRLEEDRQEREAHAAYPQVDPSSKEFDRNLYEGVSARLLQAMVKGEKLTAKEATEKELGLSKKALKEASETGAKQELENIAAKEAASLEATASSGRATEDQSDLERLSEATKQGGPEGMAAITERLKRGAA